MTWKYSILKACSTLALRPYHPPSGILFPYAHVISDIIPEHVRHLHAVPCIARFESDVDFLCRRYQPLQLSELQQIREHRDKSPARYFLLSFDDGLREVYDVIAPILRKEGVPAIFFLNSAMIDNKQLMWRHKISLLIERAQKIPGRIPPQMGVRSTRSLTARLKALRSADEFNLDDLATFFELDFDEYLQRVKPYLTTSQILELASAGFEFGSHSETHPYFDTLTVVDQKRQVSESVRSIRALGVSCRYFAFPFHDSGVPRSVFDHITQLGVTLSFGTSEGRVDSVPFSFQRFSLEGSNGDSSLPEILRNQLTKSSIRNLCGTGVIRRT